eukprot:2207595-Pyramimonas_sp.AAC.1
MDVRHDPAAAAFARLSRKKGWREALPADRPRSPAFCPLLSSAPFDLPSKSIVDASRIPTSPSRNDAQGS